MYFEKVAGQGSHFQAKRTPAAGRLFGRVVGGYSFPSKQSEAIVGGSYYVMAATRKQMDRG